jgi:galactose mutarotase-like enzyme
MSRPATGGEIGLVAPGVSAALDLAAGGRLASLVVGGRERLLGRPAPRDRGIRWGSFLMAPWPGRIAGAEFGWSGRTHRLAANDGPNAIHGVLFDRRWDLVEVSASEARLAIDLWTHGWPLGGSVRQSIRLAAGSVELSAEIVAGEDPMPAGLGWHPWFRRPDRGDLAVRVEAVDTLESDAGLIPTGRRAPVDDATDLRSGPLLGERRLDHVYPDVRTPVVVTWPDLVLTMRSSAALRTFVVHSPPSGVCVEPQTEWPDAIALSGRGVTGTGLVPLGPGESLRATTTWEWTPVP